MREKVKCLAPFHAITPVVQIAELGRIFITSSVTGPSFRPMKKQARIKGRH
jgi:hypothetical protein